MPKPRNTQLRCLRQTQKISQTQGYTKSLNRIVVVLQPIVCGCVYVGVGNTDHIELKKEIDFSNRCGSRLG